MKVQRHAGFFIVLVAFVTFTSAVWANPYMGEYKGTYHPDGMTTMNASAKVIAEGDDVYYRIVIKAIPNEENQDGANIEIYGSRQGSTVHIGDRAGGYRWNGQIQNGHLSARSEYGQHFELDKFVRKSPKEGLKPPQDAVVLLPFKDGVKPDMSAWTNSGWKKRDNGAMQVNKGGNNTKEQFGDIEHFHLEFKLPLEPNNRGQGRANSGVYFAGQFEVQVLDSFGLVHTSGDCAGLYNRARARVNACLPPETCRLTMSNSGLHDSMPTAVSKRMHVSPSIKTVSKFRTMLRFRIPVTDGRERVRPPGRSTCRIIATLFSTVISGLSKASNR